MTDLDDRLRDAFTALDGAITVPPRTGARDRRPIGKLLLAAAAVLAVVAAISLSLTVDTGDGDVGVAAGTTSPRAFDRDAAAVCRYIRTNRARPQFATVEAYRVVATSTLEVAATASVKLRSIRPPSDDPTLVVRVVDDIADVDERARHVLDIVELDRLEDLPSAWQTVDEYWNIALGALADHGAEGCAP